LRQPGALVSRQELAKELWPHLHVNFEHSLNSAVNTLRQALQDSPRESRFIETRSGLGYRFIAPIEELSSPRRSSPNNARNDVHRDYLQGRFFLNKMTSEGIQRAIGCFQSALTEDPGCALAHSGMADSYCELALSGTVSAVDVSTTAREAATAALKAQPNLAEAHLSMGRVRMIFERDWGGAHDDCSRAGRIDPSLPAVHRAHAFLAAARSRHDDALADIRHAQELDPLSLPVGFEHAWLLYLAGHFEEAVAQCWRVLALEPSFAPTQAVLGLSYCELGSFDEAVTELDNACTCSDQHPSAVASLGFAYAAAGLRDEAQGVLADLMIQSQRRHISNYWFAVVYAGLNQRYLALKSLKTACSQRDPLLLWLDVDPRLATLQADPDFVSVRRSLPLA